MASSDCIEPNFELLSNIGTFSSEHSNLVDKTLVEQTLDGVASLVSLRDTNVAVPGRIKGKMEANEEAGASEYVLDTIREGYKLVFVDNVLPPANFRSNIASALAKPTFLYDELLRLEALGCIKRVNSRTNIVNPCIVLYLAASGAASWTLCSG